MKRILLIGKPDGSYISLKDRLSGRYGVRFGSSGTLAAEALLKSSAPSLIVVRLSDTEREVMRYISAGLADVPVIALGTKEEADGITELHFAAVCEDSADSAYDAVCRVMPFSSEDENAGTLTVMVVDDDAAMLRMMRAMLGGEYDMVLATSGIKALKLLERKKPDVILLDYEMPEMNGIQTLERIRADESLADIPVIFLTGTADEDVIEHIRAADVSGYLIKPADTKDVREAVNRAAAKG